MWTQCRHVRLIAAGLQLKASHRKRTALGALGGAKLSNLHMYTYQYVRGAGGSWGGGEHIYTTYIITWWVRRLKTWLLSEKWRQNAHRKLGTILECSHESSLMICPWCLWKESERVSQNEVAICLIEESGEWWVANVGMRWWATKALGKIMRRGLRNPAIEYHGIPRQTWRKLA